MRVLYAIPDTYPRFASGLIFLAAAAAIFWMVLRAGKELPRRNQFRWMASLFFLCAGAEFVRVLPAAQALPGLVAGARLFLFVCLLVLSIVVLFSTPLLSFVIRGSYELIRRRGQERFYALVQAAPMAVISTDRRGQVTSWNPSAERIFGWTEKEIVGTLAKTVPPERMEEQLELLARTLKGHITSGFESERVRRDGTRFPVGISTAPLYDEDDNLTGIMATVEDISERKRIGRELSEKSSTLTAVTQALNTFLETGDCGAASRHLLARALKETQSEFGFLGVALEGPVLRVLAHEGIRRAREENDELYDAKLRQYATHGYFEVSHQENLLGEVMHKGQTVVSNEFASDPRAGVLPPGHPRMQSFLGVPIFKGTAIVGVLAVANRPGGYSGEEVRSLETMSRATGVLYDNYRQHLKHAQLEEQRSQLENEFRQAQKMEVLGQLSGGVAHDFNNMLMVLSGSTELLERTLPAHSAAGPHVEQIRRTIEKAAAITRQLLAFSRKQVLDAKPIDLHEVLTDCEYMLPRLIGSDVQLTFQHHAAQARILADASQLEQVIANLAINARDAMPDGGSLVISTRNATGLPEGDSSSGKGGGASGWVVLEVKDSGSGMDEHTRNHLFEPFFTTKPVGKGTGLGLSTVYGIVRQFGGQIHVQSQPGTGSCFQIFFPVHHLPLEAEPASSTDGRAAEEPQGLTILLVDDEASLRGAIAEYLRGAGHRVLEAHSPGDALELVRSHPSGIDTLLTDIIMPGIRGTELARQVEEIHPGVHVIYMSGFAQNLPETQIPPGAPFLQKPFRFASLAEQLKLVPRRA
ncbi:MAG TPA: PAS domain S-box protein [Candidatus Sulfotelmatobacter sp.]|nr:PAS domain S-box protein [Candidatus Sulfotelmatobacter sp.]